MSLRTEGDTGGSNVQLGKIAGISLRVHPAFLVVLGIYAVLGLGAQAILVFTLVMGHELVHLLAAKAYGFKVTGLEIFPLGGVAYCDGLFEGRKVEESLMALAGPLFNVVLLFLAEGLRWQGFWNGSFSEDFVRYNFWLAAFNLIPVLPLDGGRVVRALFSGVFGFVRVTKGLAWAGRWLGIALIVFALTTWLKNGLQEGTLFLIILAGFFWLAGGKEIASARVTFLRQLTQKKEELMRKGLMPSHWLTVHRETPVIRIVEELTADRYTFIALTDDLDGLGQTFSETQVLDGMMREGISYPVGKL